MTSRLLVDKLEGKTTSGTIQMPSGHIIQTVRMTPTNTANSTTSTSYVDTNLSLSITPKFSNSLIIITVSASWLITGSSFFYYRLYRNGSDISLDHQINGDYGSNGMAFSASTTYTDSPNSTSSQTYLIKLKTTGGTAYIYREQHMVLQEIAQ
tara:strand:+ start:20 stop:478 length:459 start_codon:yes stop_codon:yes gene_type:complete